MIGYTTQAFFLATALVGSAVAAPSANAGTQFDGRWSAVGFPRTGVCTHPFRIEGQIINGIMLPTGPYHKSVPTEAGRVAPNGAVNLTVSVGPYHAVVFGRLSNNSGSGSWHIQGPKVTCSGTWSARRS
jgi:hypothetical protein